MIGPSTWNALPAMPPACTPWRWPRSWQVQKEIAAWNLPLIRTLPSNMKSLKNWQMLLGAVGLLIGISLIFVKPSPAKARDPGCSCTVTVGRGFAMAITAFATNGANVNWDGYHPLQVLGYPTITAVYKYNVGGSLHMEWVCKGNEEYADIPFNCGVCSTNGGTVNMTFTYNADCSDCGFWVNAPTCSIQVNSTNQPPQ